MIGLGALKPILLTSLLVGGVGAVYLQGRADCASKHARKAAQEAQEWAVKLRVSEAEAYRRSLQAAEIDRDNEEKVDEIAETASRELGAGDICLSDDVVDRLRDLN